MQKLARVQFIGFCLIVFSLLIVNVTAAQGANLVYGQAATGELNDQTPIVLFTFQGAAGEIIGAQVSAGSPNLDLTLTLLSPAGVPLATRENDPFGLSAGDARLGYQLTESGVYSLLVGSSNNTRGAFLIRLVQQASLEGIPFLNGSAQVDVAAGTQSLLVVGNAAAPTTITIESALVQTAYSVEVRDPMGHTIAVVSNLPSATLSLPAADGQFVVVVQAGAANAQGVVTITQGINAVAPILPLATEEVGSAAPPANICSVTPASGPVNVRSGPGTEFNVVATLQAGQFLEVVGQNGGWYVVKLPANNQGWIAGSVTVLNGPCGNLPLLQAPAVLPAAVTPTFTPPAVQQQPTATVVEGQQQPTETATATEVVQQVAPADNNYVLNVPLDGTASLSDFVSYPNGDVEDVVSYDTSGLNANSALPGGRGQLSIVLSCSGTGANFITFRIDGQNFSCGQVFQRTVNADSDTGAIRITATGADAAGTYVQWSLNASLTRLP
ncbi:MAG: SH3 domain-containing protein [Anaerolineae bacterium]|nr:SH3 domain-containing protein [Anaerolineae bacterium]